MWRSLPTSLPRELDNYVYIYLNCDIAYQEAESCLRNAIIISGHIVHKHGWHEESK